MKTNEINIAVVDFENMGTVCLDKLQFPKVSHIIGAITKNSPILNSNISTKTYIERLNKLSKENTQWDVAVVENAGSNTADMHIMAQTGYLLATFVAKSIKPANLYILTKDRVLKNTLMAFAKDKVKKVEFLVGNDQPAQQQAKSSKKNELQKKSVLQNTQKDQFAQDFNKVVSLLNKIPIKPKKEKTQRNWLKSAIFQGKTLTENQEQYIARLRKALVQQKYLI